MKSVIATTFCVENQDIVSVQSRGIDIQDALRRMGSLVKRANAKVETLGNSVRIRVNKGQGQPFVSGMSLLLPAQGIQVNGQM